MHAPRVRLDGGHRGARAMGRIGSPDSAIRIADRRAWHPGRALHGSETADRLHRDTLRFRRRRRHRLRRFRAGRIAGGDAPAGQPRRANPRPLSDRRWRSRAAMHLAGVLRFLGERNVGFDWGTPDVRIPIVVSAVIDDLAVGDPRIRVDDRIRIQSVRGSDSQSGRRRQCWRGRRRNDRQDAPRPWPGWHEGRTGHGEREARRGRSRRARGRQRRWRRAGLADGPHRRWRPSNGWSFRRQRRRDT